jgi:hypothetical protein
MLLISLGIYESSIALLGHYIVKIIEGELSVRIGISLIEHLQDYNIAEPQPKDRHRYHR